MAPKREIDITPGMERAGLEALFSFDVVEDDNSEIVREIYRFMEAARRRSLPKSHPLVQRST